MEIRRGLRSSVYIFFEMIPSLLLGLTIFLSVILMFQVLRLTEFTIIHGGSIFTTAEVIFYMCISLLPVLFPMSLLFAILLTYSRLSQDSEIVAMKACGISMNSIILPGIVLGILVSIISAQTAFYIAPWGNRQFELLYTEIGHTKAAAVIKEGTFSEGFFDLVVYANEVDARSGELKNVFIYDENQSVPMTIIAKTGKIIPDPLAPGHNVLLRLEDGNIHRSAETHTKIQFNSYDVRLIEPLKLEERKMTPPSMTYDDLQNSLKNTETDADSHRIFTAEFHKRWAVSTLCLIFAIIAMGLGIQTNRRNQKSNAMILCVIIIIVYWSLYVAMEGLARSGSLPPAIAMWVPSALFFSFGLWKMKKSWE